MRDRIACVQATWLVLPTELCLMVFADLVPEYATTGLTSLFPDLSWRQKEEEEKEGGFEVSLHTIDRNADIWARHVHHYGVRYVANLSNSSFHGTSPKSTSPVPLQTGSICWKIISASSRWSLVAMFRLW